MELLKNSGDTLADLITTTAITTGSAELTERMIDAVGSDLEWRAEDSPAVMQPSIFINAAYGCKGNERLIREHAESYHKMFGIPVDEAVRRIKIAGSRS